MDEREKMRSWIDRLVELSAEKGPTAIKQDIDLLMAGVSTLSYELVKAAQASATQGSNQAKSAKRAPKKAPQRRPRPPSNANAPKPKQATQGRSVERSGEKPSASQSQKPKEPPLSLQKQQLRHEIYGRDTQDKQLRQAAKALTS